jgi:hypothetical protein
VVAVLAVAVIGGPVLTSGPDRAKAVAFIRVAEGALSTKAAAPTAETAPKGTVLEPPGYSASAESSFPDWLFALVGVSLLMSGFSLYQATVARDLVRVLRSKLERRADDRDREHQRLATRLAHLEGPADSGPVSRASPRDVEEPQRANGHRLDPDLPLPKAPSGASAKSGESFRAGEAPRSMFRAAEPAKSEPMPSAPQPPPIELPPLCSPDSARAAPGAVATKGPAMARLSPAPPSDSTPKPRLISLDGPEDLPSPLQRVPNRPFGEQVLPEAWSRFVQLEEGRYKGDWVRFEREIRGRVQEGFVRVQRHPRCEELAIVVVMQPDGSMEAHGLPVGDSYRNVMKYFDADDCHGFGQIRRVHCAAQFNPDTLNAPSGPELVQKGKVSL